MSDSAVVPANEALSQSLSGGIDMLNEAMSALEAVILMTPSHEMSDRANALLRPIFRSLRGGLDLLDVALVGVPGYE